jgi:hypothetical protein
MSHPSSQSSVSRLESHYIVENEDWGYEREREKKRDKLDLLLRLVLFLNRSASALFFPSYYNSDDA